MAQRTDIEWCDSSINLMMGCDGCELWNPKAGVKHCYAGTLTDRWGGKSKGWPESFDKPQLFLERLAPALRWPDLTGKERPGKPWLNGQPRLIFLNDLGDTFTESLPLDWLAPLLPQLADSPHVWMLLTKRPKRMREFSEKHPLPLNVWPGTSVTTQASAARVGELLGVQGGGVRWVSAEPLLGPVELRQLKCGYLFDGEGATYYDALKGYSFWGSGDFGCHGPALSLVIAGGESGPDARACDATWVRSLAQECRDAGVPFFLKQMGANVVTRDGWPHEPGNVTRPRTEGDGFGNYRIRLRDPKGGDPSEWPEDLKVRQFPEVPNGHR